MPKMTISEGTGGRASLIFTVTAFLALMMGKANQPGVSFFALFYRGFMIAITTHVLKLPAMTMPAFAWSTERHCFAERGFRPDS